MEVSIQFIRRLSDYSSRACIAMLLPAEPQPAPEEMLRFSQKHGVILISSPFPRKGQTVMACATPDGVFFQPQCFLSEVEEALYSPGTDLSVFPTPFGKIALCGGADIFQPQYARYAALKGCVLLAVSTKLDDPDLLIPGPWSACQANCLPTALALPEGGRLILPCVMTDDHSGFGRESFDTDELSAAYDSFPIFHSLNRPFYRRYREVLEE